ncbi:MAG: 16S rRNA (cytosine(1402)-N(4))-methyltransferase RsmH [Candidatus Cloacimonetes bacterium]|jgi:16S rRNA (cytosine1402-N4)-methyltransferase|nr:16S rRNA (cytosine(1402)-N(4))-methyltransferase RsmH [Candidatus Cloacimonadota bacterium]
MNEYHVPVLLSECLEALDLQDGKIYVDATFGGGGHSAKILESGKDLKLFAFDQDPDSIEQSKVLTEKYPERFVMIQDNFANLRTGLALERVKKVDGILFDLGVSSHQINEAARGFSFSGNGKLNMRMDKESELTAADVVNTYSFEKLTKIFREYGEEKEAARIARNIILERDKKEIKTTLQLSQIIEDCLISHKSIKAKARIFQALRIYINKEMDVLQTALNDSVKILNPGGRVAVISYHSLEDRIVKNLFKYEEKSCICPPEFPLCVCEKISTLEILSRKPIVPTEQEKENNPRARSAKLRIAQKREVS